MPKYVEYANAASFASRAQLRASWRTAYMRIHGGKWLLLNVAFAVLLSAAAVWGWRNRAPAWEYPMTLAVLAWLYLAGLIILLKIRGWRTYVSTVMYMEAIDDGLCKDRPVTGEGRARWYREQGSPWRLPPVRESLQVPRGGDDGPTV